MKQDFIHIGNTLDEMMENFRKLPTRDKGFSHSIIIKDEELKNITLPNKKLLGIPIAFTNCLFENYIIKNDKQKRLTSLLENYKIDRNIILSGNVGNGKTHLACATIDQLIKKGHSCRFIYFNKISITRYNKKELFSKLENVDFLVIDEYGKDLQYNQSSFEELIYRRYDNSSLDKPKCIMLIGNMKITDIAASMNKGVYSRIKQYKPIVRETDWEDFRRAIISNGSH